MRIADKVGKLEARLEGYLPFTPVNIVYRHLDKKAKNILDLGCGKGDPMVFINRDKQFQTVGVDIFPEYLNICRQKHSHNELIYSDILELEIPHKSYDIVLGLRVLEHFTVVEGAYLLGKMEAIARKQVIIITPVEQFKQSSFDNNRFQEHKYIWSPAELRFRGYKLYLNGLKGFQHDSAVETRFQKIFAFGGLLLWVIMGWLPLVFPSVAANMVAVKDLK